MNIDFKIVGQRIAQRRHDLGLKQAEVNEMAGLSDKYLSHIETARTTPSIEVLMRICDALGTTPDYILLGSTVNEDSSKAVQEKVKLIKGAKQLELLSSFVDWLDNQNF